MNSDPQPFVVLEHWSCEDPERADHFDLMLKTGDVLATWELFQWPPEPRQSVRRLADHRIDYLEYQGPVSGGRGFVKRIDEGRFEIRSSSADEMELILASQKFSGTVCLQRGEPDQRWVLSVLSASAPGNSE